MPVRTFIKKAMPLAAEWIMAKIFIWALVLIAMSAIIGAILSFGTLLLLLLKD